MVNPQKIWSSSQLPSLPTVAVKLLEQLRSPEVSVQEVVNLIKTDPALSAKILKASNSSYFGFNSRVTAIDRAVPLLGTTVVSSLALSFSLVSQSMTKGAMAQFYNDYWLHSIVQASAAEVLGSRRDPALGCEYFLGGLLLDIGRLAMLKTIPDDYLPALERATQDPRPLHQIEDEILSVNHVRVGYELMKNWGMPESLLHAINLHHSPFDKITAEKDNPNYPFIQGLALASCIGDCFCSSQKGGALHRLKKLATEFYDLNEQQIEELMSTVRSKVSSTGEMLSVSTADLGDSADLMAAANEQLAHLAMRAQAASSQAEAKQKAVEVERQRLQSENEMLQQQAMNDTLTRIYNRRFFDDALAKEVVRSSRYASPVAVLFLDVDHFKQLNDKQGHAFGDLVLQRLAAVVSEVLRTSDVFARYGGEEFVVIASHPTEKGLEKLGERIRERVEQESFLFEGQRIPVTISAGGAITVPGRDCADVAKTLLAAADEALYESKRNGRNQVRLRVLLSEDERKLLQTVTQRRFSRWLVNNRIIDIAAASQALLKLPGERRRIGDLAQQYKLLDDVQIRQVLATQESTGGRFGEVAVQLGLIARPQLVELLSLQQEDPQQLASTLIKMGTIEPQRCSALLNEYWQDSPIRVANLVPAPA